MAPHQNLVAEHCMRCWAGRLALDDTQVGFLLSTKHQYHGTRPTTTDVSCRKLWVLTPFPWTFFPNNPRQGLNLIKECSSFGYGEVFELCVNWPCLHISKIMSHPSSDAPKSSLFSPHQVQMPLPGSEHITPIFLLSLECDMLILPPYFCSFSSFLKWFPSFCLGLPNPLKSHLLHQTHPGGSYIMLAPLSWTSTSVTSLHHRVQQHITHWLAVIFFQVSELRAFKLNHVRNG